MIAPIRRILAMAGKEVLHVQRDPRSLFLALGMPVMLLVLFGYGVSFDIDHIPVVVVDLDESAESRELATRVLSSGELVGVGRAQSAEEGIGFFRRREASAILIVPRGFARDLARGDEANVQLLVDGSDGSTATQVIGKAEALVATSASAMLAERLPFAMPTPPLEVRASTWFNPSGRSALFLVPGLTAYILAIVAVLLTALTISREWEQGSMQQLFTTPVGRLEIVIGKLLPYLALGIVATLLVLTAGAWIFDVPVRGNPAALAVCAILFLAGMLGQGLLVSVVAKNQMVATQVATMTSMLPSMLLSGFVFPIENMPAPLQVITRVVPARYFVDALRAVLLRGAGFADVWHDIVALAIFAVAILAIATGRFKRELA